ncbi:unnamed protein product, partial [Didymodactylos carnosus]
LVQSCSDGLNHEFRIAESSNDGDASQSTINNNPSLIHVLVKSNERMMKPLIDTGATNTIITAEALRTTRHQKFNISNQQLLALADGIAHLKVLGTTDLRIKINNINTTITATVVRSLFTECIIGTDFINKYRVQIDAGNQTVTVCCGKQQQTIPIIQSTANAHVPMRLKKTVVIPPKQEGTVIASVAVSKAKVLFKPSYNLKEKLPLMMANNMLEIHDHQATISVFNPSNYPFMLQRGVILGVSTLPMQQPAEIKLPQKKSSPQDHINRMLNEIHDSDHRNKIEQVLVQFKGLFDTNKLTVAKTEVSHVINT